MPPPGMANWKEIAAAAQRDRDQGLALLSPPLPSRSPEPDDRLNVTQVPYVVLTEREIEITDAVPEHLLSSLATGELSSVDVSNAFLRRAALAQNLVNCVTELLPRKVLHRAKQLDDFFAKHGKTVGPFHGLPISTKEHIGLEGLRVNGGFCCNWDNVAEKDAHVLKILHDAGCVFYARTTEPQTLMHLETSSNLYGETVNPFNRRLTAGGSSGGEGALIAMRGSVLGIGSDIGGSIRSPAANNGLYGFKPSSYRLPMDGVFCEMSGQEQIVTAIGPLSSSFGAIKLFMKTVIDSKPWIQEPSLVPIPWRDSQQHLPDKVKVGIMWDDDVVKPHPPITRALKQMHSRLSAACDVDIVDWKPYRHDYAWELVSSLYFADGGDEEKNCIRVTDEPWRPLSEFIITDNPHCRRRSIEEVWHLTRQRERYRTEYARLWNDSGTEDSNGHRSATIDVILCPAGPGAAPPLNCSRYWGYTSQWNLLDYPCLVFPVTSVQQDTDLKDTSYQPRNQDDRYNYELYSPETYKDAPICLQLVGRRYEEEKVLQAFEHIRKHF